MSSKKKQVTAEDKPITVTITPTERNAAAIRKRRDRKTERIRFLRKKWAQERMDAAREDLDDDSDDFYGGSSKTQADWDNYSNQLNPNNDAYHSSRR